VSRDPFEGVLDPFAWWDISGTYDKYAGFFDLVIYSAIFIALSNIVFTSRFTGRAGKAMATTIGIALGVSLAIAERQFGWNLRQAGPIAVLIALLLVGFLILHVLIRIHVSWKLAVPLTYVLVYLFVRAMSPALLAALSDRVPFINLLSAIIFLLCVWQVGVALWPRRSGDGAPSGHDASFIAGLDRPNEEREIRIEKKIKRHLAPEARRETARLEHSLRALAKELEKDRPDFKAVAQTLSSIAHRADDVVRTIDRIRMLDRRIRNHDFRQLQDLGSYYQELNDADKERLRDQISLERRKIVQEHAIVELAEACERRHGQLRATLDEAARACFAGDRASAAQHVAAAAAIEDEQRRDLERLQDMEKRLLSLTKLKLRREAS
jgi:hypothetical protein